MPETAIASVLSGLGSGLLWAGAIALWWALFAIIALAVADPRVQPTRTADRQIALLAHKHRRDRRPPHGRPVHQTTPTISWAQARSLSPATPRE